MSATPIPESERRDDVVASLAITLDGYVCRPNGDVDYLERYPIEEFDFDAWADRVGALVMGSASYTQTVGWGWTWGSRPTLVLTSRTDLPVPDGADIRFRSGPSAELIRAFAAETPGRTWVFGGGAVVTAALLGGVVDTLDLTMVPEAIGEGIPLFTESYSGPLRLIDSVPYANSAIRLVYDTSPD